MTAAPEQLEQTLAHKFSNPELLLRALTHRSWTADRSLKAPEHDNEQLEFLGDAVLGFFVSESLVARHPSASEGQLSQWKSHLVSAAHLYHCALNIGLGEFIRLGRGEERNGGRERKALLANAFEAVIAALFLDGGFGVAGRFVQTRVLDAIEATQDFEGLELLNSKSVVQERAQALGLPVPRYTTVETNGPEHAKIFVIEGRIGNQFTSRAQATSKKEASQRAAQLLLEQLPVG